MALTEFPAEVAELLERVRSRLAAREYVGGVYVYGSLVAGDYSPAVSDIDVIVVAPREPDEAMMQDLMKLHTEQGVLAAQLGSCPACTSLQMPCPIATACARTGSGTG
jgi:predicted nucleotidyltransferase